MSLNARQIAELLDELRPLVVGLPLREVQPLPPRDLLLILEPPAGRAGPAVLRLRLSADPDHSRLHLQQGRVHRAKGSVAPFFQRLQRELVGATLTRLDQVRGDRIVRAELRGGEVGEPRALFAELTGRHANLVLCDRTDRVLDLLVPPPRAKGAPRLAVGEVWAPPPGRAGGAGDAPGVLEALPEPSEAPPAVRAGHPALAPLSWRVEASLGAAAAEREDQGARRRLERRVERKLARARGLHTGLEQKLAATDRAERVRLDGELLAGHLHLVERGAKQVTVQDWYGEGQPERTLELDPRRSPSENVERYFQRYKKLERSRAEIPAELERARRRVLALEALLAAAADPERDPEELDAAAVAEGLLDPLQEADPRRRKAPAPRLPYRVFEGARGTEIRVGRSARDNDALSLKLCNGNDLWFHTADAPGSHVVLRTSVHAKGKGKGREPEADPEELLDAAHLAVHFSPLQGAEKADVHVCACKQVHKPKGAKPGLVTLSGGRILQVRVQPERLERLLRADRR